MRFRRPIPSVALASALALLAGAPPTAAGPWLPGPGEYVSELRVSHTQFTSEFDGDGEEVRLPLGLIHERRQLLSHNELGWKPWLSVILAVPFRSVSSRGSLADFSGTSTGLADLLVGAHVEILDGPTAVAVQAAWQMPLLYERAAVPPLGDALHHVSGDLQVGFALGRLGFFQGEAGYAARLDIRRRSPGEPDPPDPVDHLRHRADVAVWAAGPVLVAGRYAGFNSLGDSDRRSSSYAAGPEVLYRVDDRLDVFAGAIFDLAGKNAVASNTYYAGLTFKQTGLHRLQGFLGGTRRP